MTSRTEKNLAKTSRRQRWLIAVWTALAVASLPAQARAECTFQFGGTVTELRFDFGNPPYDVREGDVWSIIYEFDTTAAGDIICPVFDTNGGAVGFYQAITSYTFTIQAPTGLIIHTETQTCSPGFCGTIDVFDKPSCWIRSV